MYPFLSMGGKNHNVPYLSYEAHVSFLASLYEAQVVLFIDNYYLHYYHTWGPQRGIQNKYSKPYFMLN